MRTRMFLRTMEFLWQEGHTAHATKEEAVAEAEQMLQVYTTFAEDYMALPVVQGTKTASERFAGAVETYCIEALMQDGKALQAGTSHFLGQNFAKAFDCTFQNKNNELEHVWATSWGVSTRLIGALIMTHSDDQGLVLPPRLAPTQVAIVPIFRNDEEQAEVMAVVDRIQRELEAKDIRVKVDARESQRPGWKFAEYEAQGVPTRLAIGPRDVKNDNAELARRDTKEKTIVPQEGLAERIVALLDEIQQHLYDRAFAYREEHTTEVQDYDAFKEVLNDKGGFIVAPWDGTEASEAQIKDETKATIRCIPFDQSEVSGTDLVSGKPATHRVLFAKAY